MILNRVKDYYENDKERLRKQARDKYRSLSQEERKREYGRNRYKSMSKEKKQELNEYDKNYREAKKLKQKILTFFSFHYIKRGTRSNLFRRKLHH